MKLATALCLLVLFLIAVDADAGRGGKGGGKGPKPRPEEPAPDPEPDPEYPIYPDGPYVGDLGGRTIEFTATPIAFMTLYGELESDDPEVAYAYVSGNYSTATFTMGIDFVYVAHDGSVHHWESFWGSYSIAPDGSVIFTGDHGTAVFTPVR